MTVSRRRAITFVGSILAAPFVLRGSMDEASAASVTVGAEIPLAPNLPLAQYRPSLIALPGGRFAAMWENFAPVTFKSVLYLRSFTAKGLALAAPQLIFGPVSAWGQSVLLGDGRILGVARFGPTGSRLGIFSQAISPSGRPSGRLYKIGDATKYDLGPVLACRLGEASVLCVWRNGSGCTAALLSSTGAPIRYPSIFGDIVRPTSLAPLGKGWAAIAYVDPNFSSDSTDFIVLRIDATGKPQPERFLLHTDPGATDAGIEPSGPAVGKLPDGGFVAAWPARIKGRIWLCWKLFYGNGGVSRRFASQIGTTTGVARNVPAIAVRSDGRIVIAATRGSPKFHRIDLAVWLADADGSPLTGPIIIAKDVFPPSASSD